MWAKILKAIVERLKSRDTTPPPIPFQKGDVVLIRAVWEIQSYENLLDSGRSRSR